METAPRQQNRYPRVSRARAASRAARPSGTAAAQLPQIADYRLQGAIEQLIVGQQADFAALVEAAQFQDRKSTRLNSSHVRISYAVFCLKKKKKNKKTTRSQTHSV